MRSNLKELQEFEDYLKRKPDPTYELVIPIAIGVFVTIFLILSKWWYVAVIVDVLLVIHHYVHRFHEKKMVKRTAESLRKRMENGEEEKVAHDLKYLDRDVAHALENGIEALRRGR